MQSMKRALGLGSADTDTRPPPTDQQLTDLRKRYDSAQQSHVFTFWEDITDIQRAALFNQLDGIDPEACLKIASRAREVIAADESRKIEPLPETLVASTVDAPDSDRAAWLKTGLNLVAERRCAVIVLAGGQGTRLGSTSPKGCYDIGLPSRKSLFQLQAERIRKVIELADSASNAEKMDQETSHDTITQKSSKNPVNGRSRIPWYIMTSKPTRQDTEAFFESHQFFGLKRDDVIFFDQGTLPCLSDNTKDERKAAHDSRTNERVGTEPEQPSHHRLMLENKHTIATAPDGNGGIFRALITSGAMEDLRQRGVEHVQVYCVDNCLAQVADPLFFGFAAMRKVDIATKVVRKEDPQEAVGLVVLRDGKPDVVEYSEIDKRLSEELDSRQKSNESPKSATNKLLKLRAANIVQHYFAISFLENIPQWYTDLPHHIARKKIPYLDISTGEQVTKPTQNTGTKYEQFIFDVFPLVNSLDKFACLEVAREDEFAPLKNLEGPDSPVSARNMLLAQGRRWVRDAGGFSVGDGTETADDPCGVEISPLASYRGENLARFVNGKQLRGKAYIEMTAARKSPAQE
ncbi:UDP-N-acetylglucosamine pyrophosphorylase [Savitreella phatthalungensis]